MCDNPYCPEHPGKLIKMDGNIAIIERVCAHGDITGEVEVRETGWWSSAHPANQKSE